MDSHSIPPVRFARLWRSAINDRYVSEFDVATLAKELSGSTSRIVGGPMQPKHRDRQDSALRIRFRGDELLRQTIAELVQAVRSGDG